MSFLACPKEKLPKGPWLADIAAYPEPSYTFDCGNGIVGKLKRMRGWNWNGYVTLPRGHPDSGCNYDDMEKLIHVHGDLTYGPGNGTFGFDTSHSLSGDIVPAQLVFAEDPEFGALFQSASLFGQPDHFWTFEETKAEVKRVAQQFAQRA